MMVFITCAVSVHKGLKKLNNEDNYLMQGKILREPEIEKGVCSRMAGVFPRGVFAVFDGLGGLADGEQAALLAAKTMQKEIWLPSMQVTEGKMRKLIEKLNTVVSSAVQEKQCRMGTTAAILMLNHKNLIVGNLGDSRVYQYQQGILHQLSTDHSDRDVLKELGIKDRKPSLLQYVGMDAKEILPTVFAHSHKNGDRFLLCSDGLTDMVSDAEIEEVCSKEKKPQDCTEALVNLALKNGGKDNITAIICDIRYILRRKKNV